MQVFPFDLWERQSIPASKLMINHWEFSRIYDPLPGGLYTYLQLHSPVINFKRERKWPLSTRIARGNCKYQNFTSTLTDWLGTLCPIQRTYAIIFSTSLYFFLFSQIIYPIAETNCQKLWWTKSPSNLDLKLPTKLLVNPMTSYFNWGVFVR